VNEHRPATIASGPVRELRNSFLLFETLFTVRPWKSIEPSHVVLARRAGDRSRLVVAFRKLAEAHLTGSGRA
jgi:hypothetical protein